MLVLPMRGFMSIPLRRFHVAWYVYQVLWNFVAVFNQYCSLTSEIWEALRLVLLMAGTYEVRLSNGFRCHDIHTKFHKGWLRHSEVAGGAGTHTDLQIHRQQGYLISLLLYFQNKESSLIMQKCSSHQKVVLPDRQSYGAQFYTYERHTISTVKTNVYITVKMKATNCRNEMQIKICGCLNKN
jgi:hypothetical protein